MECSSAFMHNRTGDVPIYPDRILFSEDLVNYIIHSKYGIDFLLHGARRFRQNTYNAFSEVVEEGVDNLFVTVDCLQHITEELKTWDKGTYFSVASKMEKNILKEGLDPLRFLSFCVYVTVLAREFISNGLLNAPILAVVVIYAALTNYDMFLGGWDSLNRAAMNTVNYDWSVMTPDTSSTDMSDSELQHRMSRSSSLDDAERRNMDIDDNVSSNGSQDECKLHAAISEDGSMSNEERHNENLQLLQDISIGKQHTEHIHDFTISGMRGKDEDVTQQEDVKDGLKFNEPLEDKNLRKSFECANGRTLQQVSECQNLAEDNETSTNGETHDANMHETSSIIIDRNLFFEYMEFRALAALSKSDTEDDS